MLGHLLRRSSQVPAPSSRVFYDSLQKALGNDVTEESFDESRVVPVGTGNRSTLCFEFGLELDDVAKERGVEAAEGLSEARQPWGRIIEGPALDGPTSLDHW
eukprot:Skav208056  [mRNA]  locus=scaffold1124:171665:173476:- [translate_table: standard]